MACLEINIAFFLPIIVDFVLNYILANPLYKVGYFITRIFTFVFVVVGYIILLLLSGLLCNNIIKYLILGLSIVYNGYTIYQYLNRTDTSSSDELPIVYD
jgi:hypothetical protein